MKTSAATAATGARTSKATTRQRVSHRIGSSREISSLPSTSETSSRRVPAHRLRLVSPGVLADRRRHHHHGVGARCRRRQLGLRLRRRRAVRAGLRVVHRLDGHRVDLAGGVRLQRLHQLAVRLDGRVEIGVEFADGALVQLLQAGLDVVLVHVDQHAGPVGGGLHHAGAVVKLVDVVAVPGPDQHAQNDRHDREHAKRRRGDAEAGEDGTVVVARSGVGSSSGMAVRVPGGVWHPGWGDGRSYPLGHRPEPRRLRRPPPRRSVRPRQRPLADRIRDPRRPRHRRCVPVAVRPRRGTGPRPDHRGGRVRRGRRTPTSSASATCTPASWTRRLWPSAVCSRCSTNWPTDRRRRRPRGPGRGAGRAAAHRCRRRHRRLRRHRLQGLDPLPAAPEPVRARPARRVLLPRRAARRDPRRLSAAHRGDVRAGVRRATTPRRPRASSRWRPSSPPRTGTSSSAATPT